MTLPVKIGLGLKCIQVDSGGQVCRMNQRMNGQSYHGYYACSSLQGEPSNANDLQVVLCL